MVVVNQNGTLGGFGTWAVSRCRHSVDSGTWEGAQKHLVQTLTQSRKSGCTSLLDETHWQIFFLLGSYWGQTVLFSCSVPARIHSDKYKLPGLSQL